MVDFATAICVLVEDAVEAGATQIGRVKLRVVNQRKGVRVDCFLDDDADRVFAVRRVGDKRELIVRDLDLKWLGPIVMTLLKRAALK